MEKQNNDISVKGVVPPLVMKKSDPLDAFKICARDFLQGAEAISTLKVHPRNFAVLAGNALECMLKLYLLKKGVEYEEVKKCSHDLVRLWGRVSTESAGLFPEELPEPLKSIHSGHGKDMLFRYQTIKGNRKAGVSDSVADIIEVPDPATTLPFLRELMSKI